MKNVLDSIQILIQYPGISHVIVLIGLHLLLSALKATGAAISAARYVSGKVLMKITLWRAIFLGIIAIFVVEFMPLGDWIQYIETKSEAVQEYNGFSTSKTVAIFEAELRRQTTSEEYNIITDSIQAWRVEFGMDSTAAYECMVCECSLNPFVIRKDGIAAGIIQFTGNGCDKMPFKMNDIKRWCEKRDAERMMWATGHYIRLWGKNKRIKTGLDFYITVFAPGYLGFGPDKVLYNSGDAYRLNAAMDGFRIENGIIVRSPGAVNGDITVRDVGLWQKYKVGQLIKRSLKFKN